MSENMTEKYQTHYNKLLNGTFGDLVVKSISYQANIQLANDIIAEQEGGQDGVGEIIRRKRTPKKVLRSQAKPKEQVGNSNSKAKPQGQTTHPQVADVP